MEIRGARSLVKKIESARGTVDITKVSENETSESITLVPVDDSGAQVENVKINPASVTVTSVLTHDKTVRLNVNVEDTSENASSKTWTAPDEITIAGSVGALKNIESIETGVIDISGVTADSEIEIVPVLPEGVYLSDKNSSLVLKVTVEGDTEETFTLADSDIKLTGVADQVVYHFSENTFNVTVLGSREELDALTNDDVLLVADVSGIRKGESAEITLAVSIRGSELSASVSPETVTVTAE